MQFFETPSWMIVVGQLTWQSSHGGAVFIYLFLNKTMRRGIVNTFFSRGACGLNANRVSSVTTTVKLSALKPMFSHTRRERGENNTQQ